MRKYRYILYSLLLFIAFSACDQGKGIDTEKPQIDNNFAGAFPVICDTIFFGESFDFKVLFSDNVELGSYSISIHNNFDHHSHSTEVSECSLEAIKDPINPYVLIQDYNIPPGLAAYETDTSIAISSSNENGNYDEGDYHFFISLTDNEGWSAQKGLSIKMLYH